MKNEKNVSREEREDLWLEIGPASAYYGTDSYKTALENGDASPDGKQVGFEGAEPENAAERPGPENLALEPWDDVPPIDRP